LKKTKEKAKEKASEKIGPIRKPHHRSLRRERDFISHRAETNPKNQKKRKGLKRLKTRRHGSAAVKRERGRLLGGHGKEIITAATPKQNSPQKKSPGLPP